MRTPKPRRPLVALAELCGVLPRYLADDGTWAEAEDDTLVAVLAALGVPIEHPDGAPEALAELRARWADQPMEPVMVLWTARPRPLTLNLPSHVHPRDGWLVLELEEGGERRERLISAIARPVGGGTVEGRRIDTYQLRLGGSPALDVPIGYHRLRLEAPGVECSSLLLAAPRCPQARRGWGTFLPLHALRTADDWGVGRYSDLEKLAGWVGGLGGSLVGMLPLYPSFLDEPVEPSPYLPVSRLVWNELYVDPTVLPEFEASTEAKERLASPAVAEALATARRSVLVDYGSVMATIRHVLEPMAAELFVRGGERRHALESFLAAHPTVTAYARFRAACEQWGRPWQDWPDARATHLPGEPAREVVGYHLYAQWAARSQLSSLSRGEGAGLYLDLPVGVHPDGFDPWWEPGAFATGVHGGAPPDAFFSGGQDWGIYPLHPEGMRADGFRYPIAMLRRAFEGAAAVRIDHVMGLHRLYWIPRGFDARHGAYVRYRDEELRAIVAIEATRAGAAVVGEDLGTVPPEVREAMAHDGMLRSWVLQFETSAEEPLPAAPPQALASWGTHDLPRFAAYWTGMDIDERESRGQLDPADIQAQRVDRSRWRRALLAAAPGATDPVGGDPGPPDDARRALAACLGHLAASEARLAMVDLEDLWLERRPQNRPGTGAEAANWRRRSARTLEEARADPFVTAALAGVDRLRRPDRSPGSGATEPPRSGWGWRIA